jgi:hypothetical protein
MRKFPLKFSGIDPGKAPFLGENKVQGIAIIPSGYFLRKSLANLFKCGTC